MKKVLIVEDYVSVHKVCSIMASRLGIEALVAEDSESALEFLNSEEIGVAFIDQDLKDGPTGDLVAKAARGFNIPIIVTSSNTGIKEIFDEYNPVSYLPKPLDFNVFSDYIKKYCL